MVGRSPSSDTVESSDTARMNPEGMNPGNDIVAQLQEQINQLMSTVRLQTQTIQNLIEENKEKAAEKEKVKIVPTEQKGEEKGTKLTGNEKIAGLDRFRETPRDEEEIRQSGFRITAADRAEMDSGEQMKTYKNAIRGIQSKFKVIGSIDEPEKLFSFTNIVSFLLQTRELRDHMRMYGMNDVFQILGVEESESGSLKLMRETVNGREVTKMKDLLDCGWTKVSEKEIRLSCRYFRLYGSKEHVENLEWSFQAIKNSCDEEMKRILETKLIGVSSEDLTGPLIYWHLLRQITTTSDKSIRAIETALENIKITEYEGECIPMVLRDIRAAILWLEMVKDVFDRKSLTSILLTIMQTCSVENFRSFMNSVENTAGLAQLKDGNGLDYSKVMELAEGKYTDLVREKKWFQDTAAGAVFSAAAGKGTHFELSGRKKAGSKDNKGKWDPPKQGEPDKKTMDGHLYKYCRKCWNGNGRWNRADRGGHFTHEHKDKKDTSDDKSVSSDRSAKSNKTSRSDKKKKPPKSESGSEDRKKRNADIRHGSSSTNVVRVKPRFCA